MFDNDATFPAREQRQPDERRPRLHLLQLGAAACVACCIGPILAVLGAITAGGVVSVRFVGAAGLAVAAISSTVFVIVQRQRRAASRRPIRQPIAVLPTRRSPQAEELSR